MIHLAICLSDAIIGQTTFNNKLIDDNFIDCTLPLPITVISLCKKTLNTALFSFFNQSTTIRKHLEFKNVESLVFGTFLSKT